MAGGVFISYRRADSAPWAGRLRQSIVAEFGDRVVFQDVSGIPLGDPFPERLHRQLDAALVVVAVIGPAWATISGPDGRPRLDDAADWVRVELATALADPSKTVIPLLVGGAAPPPAAGLPEPLRSLAVRNGYPLRDDYWDNDIRPLLARVGELCGIQPATVQPLQDRGGARFETNVTGGTVGKITNIDTVHGDVHL